MEEGPSRKLAVLLHADVVGSTRLVQREESVAHRRMQDAFHRLSSTIGAYHGLTHEIRGDALVAEFARASDAVSAALLFQEQNAAHNATLEDDIRPRLRIGICLGEVIVADGWVTGEGIILAQRLEQIADPDGVVVQGAISETVPSRLAFEFHSLGERALKGFEQPVRAFSVHLQGQVPGPEPMGLDPPSKRPAGRRWRVVGAACILALLAGVSVWYAIPEDDVLELPRGPRVAVMPFEALAEENREFGEGLTRDLITALSQFSDLFVIALETTTQLRAEGADCRQIRDELGADHILEGTVRRSSDALRVSVQLFDGGDCAVLWSEVYDRDLTAADFFAVQDDITSEVAATIGTIDLRLWKRQQAIAGRRTESLEAYDCVLMEPWFYDTFGADRHARARDCLERAIEVDPGYSMAHAALGYMYLEEYKYGLNPRPDPLGRALEQAQIAIDLDPRNQKAHGLLANLRYITEDDFEVFYELAEHTISLNPNNAEALADHGIYMSYSGAWERGKALVAKAKRLNPRHQSWYDYAFCIDHYRKREFREALRCLLKMNLPQNDMVQTTLAATYGHLGETGNARAVIEHILAIHPPFADDPRTPYEARRMPPEFIESVLEGLRKAGYEVPEE